MGYWFERALPEEVGISRDSLSRLLTRILSLRITLHGLVIVKKGKVITEMNWKPYHNDDLHRMYSISKSFTSLAVGCLIDEGKLHYEDRVCTFFPEKLPEHLHHYISDATVRDLLMMATPHSDQSYTVNDRDWSGTFFQKHPSHPAGTIFHYDTAGAVVLCEIVEKITGMPYYQYLRRRLFDPIEASKNIYCIKTPEGTSWGGSGLVMSLHDLAKSGYVCMHHGMWKGKQILPRDYIDEAVSKKIDNSMEGGDGYGYQIWRLKKNGFGFLGMGGQNVWCFPDLDLLFACTADDQCDETNNDLLLKQAVYDFITENTNEQNSDCLQGKCGRSDSSQNKAVEGDAAGASDFFTAYKDMEFPEPAGSASSKWQEKVNGKWYVMEENPMEIRRFCLAFSGNEAKFIYENARGRKEILFGMKKFVPGELPELYFDRQIGTKGNRKYRTLASAAWVEPHKLYIRVCVTDDYLGGLHIEISFKKNEVGMHMKKTAEWFLEDYQGFAGGMEEN